MYNLHSYLMYIYIYLVLSTILPFSPLLAPRSELGCRPSAVQPPAAPEPPEQVAIIPGFSGHVIYIYIYMCVCVCILRDCKYYMYLYLHHLLEEFRKAKGE